MIEREEAFLMLSKMCSDQAEIICKGSCWGWEYYLFGKIMEATEEKVVFKWRDNQSVLEVRLDMENTFFFYGEPREMPPEILARTSEGDRMRSMVGIGLPLRVLPHTEDQYTEQNPPQREKILFIELPQGKA
jgi:hypothetical protein